MMLVYVYPMLLTQATWSFLIHAIRYTATLKFLKSFSLPSNICNAFVISVLASCKDEQKCPQIVLGED